MVKRSTLPRRTVEKAIFYINSLIPAAQNNVTLFTATEDVTLVRTIFDVQVGLNLENAQEQWRIRMEHRINAISVLGALVIAQEAIADVPKTNLFECGGLGHTNGTRTAESSVMPDRDVYRDLKGMRKLEVGDEIMLNEIASTVSAFRIVGSITFFFKQT